MKFEIRNSVSPSQRYYVRIIASNGKTLFTSETYVSKADAERAAQLVRYGAATASVVDATVASSGRR